MSVLARERESVAGVNIMLDIILFCCVVSSGVEFALDFECRLFFFFALDNVGLSVIVCVARSVVDAK